MAKVLIEFDTKTKQATLALGNIALQEDMVDYVCFSRYKNYDTEEYVWSCAINLSAKNKDEGISLRSTIYANQQEKELDGVTITEGSPQSHKSIAGLYTSSKGK
jgi:hypothetical protein